MPGLRVAFLVLLLAAGSSGQSSEVTLERLADRVRVEVGGKLFTEYRLDGKRPCLWPVKGPGGVTITRSHPLGALADGEAKDHPHHTGIWFGHGNVNGTDFWHPQSKKNGGRVELEKVLDDPAKAGRIRVRQRWLDVQGKPLAADTTTLTFGAGASARWIDWRVDVEATHGVLRFGDTKEGTLGIRMHPALRLNGKVAKGKVVNARGTTGKRVWGQRAAWIDYSGPIDGRVVGVAMMDTPGNPRYPTWWHAREYGLCAANPFGIHYFEKKPRGTGDLILQEGKTLTFRWRVVVHDGDARAADIAARHLAWKESAIGGVEKKNR